jgi:hypothetical protein
MSFPLPNSHINWLKIPALLVQHCMQLINCAPLTSAPPIGSFRCIALTQLVAMVLWNACGCYIDPRHIRPTNAQGNPIMDTIPWTLEEHSLTGHDLEAIVLMLDCNRNTVATVGNILMLQQQFKTYTTTKCKQDYPPHSAVEATGLPLLHCHLQRGL